MILCHGVAVGTGPRAPLCDTLSFMSLFAPRAKCLTWAVSFSCTAARWPSTHAVEFCQIWSSSEGCSCESFLLKTARPPVSVSFAVYRPLLNMLRGSPASLAMHQLLLNVARFLCLTCRGLRAPPARLSLHALSSQARHWLEFRTIMFWTLTFHQCNLHNSCDFWELLQHRVSSTTGHQRSLNGLRWPSFLHLCIFGACCGVFSQSYGEIRLDHLEPSNDSCALSSPPLLSRKTANAMHMLSIPSSIIATCDAASSPRAVCNSAILPFELRAVAAVFMSLKQ